MSQSINEAALALDIKARDEYRKALVTWHDLPPYAYTKAYYLAFMSYIWKMIDAGHQDMESLVFATLDRETGGKRPCFDFPREEVE